WPVRIARAAGAISNLRYLLPAPPAQAQLQLLRATSAGARFVNPRIMRIDRSNLMAVSLAKGQNVNLSKTVTGLTKVKVGLGWDARSTDGAAFDLDASAFMLKDDGKVPNDDHFVFYNQPKDPAGAIQHTGDNRSGAGAGDDESLVVD